MKLYDSRLTPKLNAIQELLDLYGTVSPGVANPRTELRQHRPYFYSGFIISLYGAFEHYIEEMVEEYVGALNWLHKWHGYSYPDALRKQYKVLLQKTYAEPRRFRQTRLKMKQLLYLLLDSEEDTPHLALEESVFRYHGANFRFATIKEVWDNINIPNLEQRMFSPCFLAAINRQIRRFSPSYTVANHRLNPDDLEETAKLVLTTFIDERNTVAHGNLSDLQSIETLQLWLNFIRLFSARLEIVSLSFLGSLLKGYCYSEKNIVSRDGHEYYSGNRVIIGTLSASLFKPILLVRERPDNATEPCLWGPVSSVQQDGDDIESLPANTELGFSSSCLHSKVKNSEIIYVVEQDKWPTQVCPLDPAIADNTYKDF